MLTESFAPADILIRNRPHVKKHDRTIAEKEKNLRNQNRGFRCFGRQSLQYTGLPSVGLKGTSHSFPQSEQDVFVISRGPWSLAPPKFLAPPNLFSPNMIVLKQSFE
jgi:hypothetical protein